MRVGAYEVLANEYRNGESQRGAQTETSRKVWRTTRRLAPTALVEMRDFYVARNGPVEPFWFYDPIESNFTHDPTGVQTEGRYCVRFDGAWEQVSGLTRTDVTFTLIELANG